jgi:hypothetical protein
MLGFVSQIFGMFTLNKNDPAQPYSSVYPYFYLYNDQNTFQLPIEDDCVDDLVYVFQLSFSPFYQRSNKGSNFCECYSELGDMTGRPNLLAILPANNQPNGEPQNGCDFLDIPQKLLIINNYRSTGCCEVEKWDVSCSCAPQLLYDIRDSLINCYQCLPNECAIENIDPITLQLYAPNLGTFSVPINYKKSGIRFQASMMFSRYVGVNLQIGVSNISQCPKFISQNNYCPNQQLCSTPCRTSGLNLTPSNKCNGCGPSPCPNIYNINVNDPNNDCKIPKNPILCLDPFSQTINNTWRNIVECFQNLLMNRWKEIAAAINLDICSFSKTSVEDMHAEIFIRHGLEFGNRKDKYCWSNVLLVPFASVGGSIPFAPERNQNVLFGLPNGNDGHYSVDFKGGFSAAFRGTIELTGEAGFTHFFNKGCRSYRMPTNKYQRFIFPYCAEAELCPGNTWHIGLGLNAYRFCGNLSFWAQYLFVNHDKDRYYLFSENCNGAFKPEQLECFSAWKNHLASVAFHYEFTPEVALGIVWQFSMQRANSYNNNTFLISLVLSGLCD